jgi:hypothetical protein
MVRNLRLVNTARLVTRASDENMKKGFKRVRRTRSVADKRSFGSAGIGMKSNSRDWRRANLPENPMSERPEIGHMKRSKPSLRWISAGNCACITEANRRNCELDRLVKLISHTRLRTLRCTIATLQYSGMIRTCWFVMMIGKGGQIRVSFVGDVQGPQTSLRLRKFGDAKMTDRHLRHTWIN